MCKVACAVALREHGLHLTGVVKSARKLFPRSYLQNRELYSERGDHVVLETLAGGHIVYAIGWADTKVETLVSTCGVTIPGWHVTERPVWVEAEAIEEVTTPCPRVVSEYFQAASAIDVHNHMRQGVLHIETSHRTPKMVVPHFRDSPGHDRD